MCNCRNANGFDLQIQKAQKLNAETGEAHGVYTRKIGSEKIAFLRKVADMPNDICCYFLADGSEVQVPQIAAIEVVSAEVVEVAPQVETEPPTTESTEVSTEGEAESTEGEQESKTAKKTKNK